jgi:hypothetical protein
MHSLLIITKEEYFASAFATAEALSLAHQRDTTVSYRPHQPSTSYIVASRLKTLFSRVQGARKGCTVYTRLALRPKLRNFRRREAKWVHLVIFYFFKYSQMSIEGYLKPLFCLLGVVTNLLILCKLFGIEILL